MAVQATIRSGKKRDLFTKPMEIVSGKYSASVTSIRKPQPSEQSESQTVDALGSTTAIEAVSFSFLSHPIVVRKAIVVPGDQVMRVQICI